MAAATNRVNRSPIEVPSRALARRPAAPPVSATDRAVRKALNAKASVDLLTEGIPFTPALWMIVVEPLEPRSISDGGIEVVEVSVEAEGHQVTVGRVLACGMAAFEGKTTAGIELRHFLPDVSEPAHLIGRHVIYQQHVGQILKLRRTGQEIKVMRLTDLLGVTADPHAWKFYI